MSFGNFTDTLKQLNLPGFFKMIFVLRDMQLYLYNIKHFVLLWHDAMYCFIIAYFFKIARKNDDNDLDDDDG